MLCASRRDYTFSISAVCKDQSCVVFQVPVYTMSDILNDLTEDEGKQLQGVVVYGNTLDSLSCVTVRIL